MGLLSTSNQTINMFFTIPLDSHAPLNAEPYDQNFSFSISIPKLIPTQRLPQVCIRIQKNLIITKSNIAMFSHSQSHKKTLNQHPFSLQSAVSLAPLHQHRKKEKTPPIASHRITPPLTITPSIHPSTHPPTFRKR